VVDTRHGRRWWGGHGSVIPSFRPRGLNRIRAPPLPERTGALHGALDGDRAQRGRGDAGKGAADAPDRRADGADDDGILRAAGERERGARVLCERGVNVPPCVVSILRAHRTDAHSPGACTARTLSAVENCGRWRGRGVNARGGGRERAGENGHRPGVRGTLHSLEREAGCPAMARAWPPGIYTDVPPPHLAHGAGAGGVVEHVGRR
jgi:hypothetical protein